MTRLKRVGDLYAASASIAGEAGAVELIAVADPRGASLDIAVRELGREVRDGNHPMLGELLAMARQLRWRLAIEPCPALYSAGRADLVTELTSLARQCKFIVGDETRSVLDDLVDRANAVIRDALPPTGDVLLQSLNEAGYEGCAVILASPRVAEGVRRWFRQLKIDVPVESRREQTACDVRDQAYLIGAPPVFGPSILTAPRARSLTYLFPSWVQDRSLPTTGLSDLAEGGIKPRIRSRKIGEEPVIPQRLRQVEDRLVPEPVWSSTERGRPPGEDEVYARRVLLAGGFAIMLDTEGEFIRTLDPNQPPGERIEMRDVKSLAPGTYLVLRDGETESDALYSRAIALLGAQAESVERSQSEWKSALRRQLLVRGRAEVIRSLSDRGVRAAAQAPAWIARTVARPRNRTDFDILLGWLGLELEPYREHANLLRRARSQAAADVRESLEAALGESDISRLERDGYLRLNLELEGFASIVATRILAISPYLEAVPRHELRNLREDRNARWLE
ncbi:hypothetical protein TH66_21335 [Carbonactinospora thermoautotrophica]|uniref:Uncharacterized protein n=1 Tax=Carbonactinospora thermoautotrophica TaxID=1469144 RepID=A0A132N7P9_9ACTN|nr:hypothetical protein [Carbonactinospora thermoautotrophica]KWW97917.1 hypothetical protein TH66_21335 [Carbonactinospora thermoautotrophica]KWX06185.1 hypothetical protein TR74_22760 [Carbonactinospora thermoautotrophica]